MRGLAESLVLHESITTTVVKAKALRGVVEPLVTRAARGKNALTTRRTLQGVLYTDAAINKLMNEIAPRYKERNGGYTRVVKIGPRRPDGAEQATIEFV